MARPRLGTGRGRRGPPRAGVRRRPHQPAEDRLRPEIRPSRPRRGSPDPSGGRTYGVRLGARAGSGPGLARRGGARCGARRLGVDRGPPAAAAAGVGDREGRPARLLRVAGGAWPGRHAAAGDRGCRRALGWAGRALLAGGWHGFLDPSGFVRGVGVASRDQPLGAGRGFLPPYSPECVEKLFGNSEWVPNGAPKAAKRGRRSPDRPPLAAKEALSRRLQLFSKQFRRDCPKSLVGARDVALWTAAKALFDPFRLPHDIRIHLRNVTQYLFGQSRKRNSANFALKPSEKSHARAKRLTIRRLIAT